MIGNFIEQSIWHLLAYDPKAPLIFSSGLFLFLFAVFAFFYNLVRKEVGLRIVYLVCFSLYFYYRSSGMYFLLLIVTSVIDFWICRSLASEDRPRARKWYVALSVGINIGMLVYFKYTNFFISIANEVSGAHLFDFKNIFLPVGISFFVFQAMSYTIDVYRRQIVPLRSWLDFLFYLSFFPQLVAGPIVRARDFLPQIRQAIVVTPYMFGRGIFLIMTGLFKKAVISDYISLNFVDRVFDNPALYSGVENLLGVYGYAMQIYCDFSGYSDMAIGIALLLGFRFSINFDSPYQSATITEFWRRWHISLSSWLRDYLYISLGGNRKGKFRQYINLMVTMLLGGLWHGAAWRFVVWGALHGVSLAVHKMLMQIFPKLKPSGSQMKLSGKIFGIFITFHLVCLGWVFFRADDMATGMKVLEQIFTNFNLAKLPEVLSGYAYVMLFMLLGYLLHFTSRRWEIAVQNVITYMPFIVKALTLVLLIWFVMQIKSSEIQPFIYFQF